jgi:glutamate synthase (NADPH/NADH) large chain
MMRVCSKNTCPAGIATQDERLRCRFSGRPEDIVTLFHFVARDIRTYLASAGLHSLTQLTGRRDLLAQKEHSRLDLSGLLKPAPMEILLDARPQDPYPHRETQLLEHGLPQPGIVYQGALTNADRAFGTLFGQALIREYPDCADGRYRFECTGYAGESFGAFLPRGVLLHLTGQANDYVGKGLSGGVIALSAPASLQAQADQNILLGNVALYGATGGELYVNGAAGERFGVRNSGALGIAEGVGEHGAEYMTGGTLLILGDIGRNFAAGMSGGRVYLYDPKRQAAANVNCRTVTVTDCGRAEEELLRRLLKQHWKMTGSRQAKRLLEQFDIRDYRRVLAPEYEHMMSLIQRQQASGKTLEEARMAAFLEKYEVKSNG